jgi:hypothetical protein
MNRPSDVTGNLSPYPTVVTVTYAHHIASSAVLMLLLGTFSTCKIAIAEKTTTRIAIIATEVKVP